VPGEIESPLRDHNIRLFVVEHGVGDSPLPGLVDGNARFTIEEHAFSSEMAMEQNLIIKLFHPVQNVAVEVENFS
jgi:hypothetical protein